MRFVCVTLLCVLAALATGCAAPQQVVRQPGAFHVPSTALRRTEVPAEYILPTDSLAEAYIPRGQRAAYGPPVAEGSAYTIYTFDAQPIGEPGGYGFRYRYMVRSGYTLP